MAFDGKIEGFPEFQKSRTDLLARAREMTWYHSVKLDDSFTTQGEFDLYPYVEHYLPFADLSRADCLDIGSGNGFWAFELERKNARSVTASDIADFFDTDFSILHGNDTLRPKGRSAPGAFGEQLRIASCLLKSKLDYRLCSVYDLRPETVGTFDLVHCGSMLMHLFGPLIALQRMASVSRDSFIITTEVELSLEGHSAVQYRGHQIPYVHFVPSPTCLVNMVTACGYEKVLRGPTFFLLFRDRNNPQLMPHTTCIGLKEGSKNVLGLPPPGPVATADQQATVEFAAVPATVQPGQTIDILLNVINRSSRMWHVQDASDAIVAGCGWELRRDGHAVETLAARIEDAIPTCNFLPPGLGTLVGVKIRIPAQEGTLRLKPFVTQRGSQFNIAGPGAAIEVASLEKPQPPPPKSFWQRLTGA